MISDQIEYSQTLEGKYRKLLLLDSHRNNRSRMHCKTLSYYFRINSRNHSKDHIGKYWDSHKDLVRKLKLQCKNCGKYWQTRYCHCYLFGRFRIGMNYLQYSLFHTEQYSRNIRYGLQKQISQSGRYRIFSKIN